MGHSIPQELKLNSVNTRASIPIYSNESAHNGTLPARRKAQLSMTPLTTPAGSRPGTPPLTPRGSTTLEPEQVGQTMPVKSDSMFRFHIPRNCHPGPEFSFDLATDQTPPRLPRKLVRTMTRSIGLVLEAMPTSSSWTKIFIAERLSLFAKVLAPATARGLPPFQPTAACITTVPAACLHGGERCFRQGAGHSGRPAKTLHLRRPPPPHTIQTPIIFSCRMVSEGSLAMYLKNHLQKSASPATTSELPLAESTGTVLV